MGPRLPRRTKPAGSTIGHHRHNGADHAATHPVPTDGATHRDWTHSRRSRRCSVHAHQLTARREPHRCPQRAAYPASRTSHCCAAPQRKCHHWPTMPATVRKAAQICHTCPRPRRGRVPHAASAAAPLHLPPATQACAREPMAPLVARHRVGRVGRVGRRRRRQPTSLRALSKTSALCRPLPPSRLCACCLHTSQATTPFPRTTSAHGELRPHRLRISSSARAMATRSAQAALSATPSSACSCAPPPRASAAAAIRV